MLYSLGGDDVVGPLQVGHKGAQLHLLAQHGFPVPPGFTIPTAAFQQHFAQEEWNELEEKSGSIGEAAKHALRIIQTRKLHEGLYESISAAYCGLPLSGGSVAVRSSAAFEDTCQTSAAGVLESYLNLRTCDEMIKAVRKCWASVFEPRALAYRGHLQLDAYQPVGVVIQKMIVSVKGGVLFTADPVTNSTRIMVIESNWGTARTVVDGVVTPDRFSIDTETGDIHTVISEKVLCEVFSPDGALVRMDLDTHLRRTPSLRVDELKVLVKMANRVVHLMGHPQDIEWTIDRHSTFILQSRPLTTVRAGAF